MLFARDAGKVTLLVDREIKSLAAEANSIDDDYSDSSVPAKRSIAGTDVYLGGYSSTDDAQTDRLSSYNNYTGCMSSMLDLKPDATFTEN